MGQEPAEDPTNKKDGDGDSVMASPAGQEQARGPKPRDVPEAESTQLEAAIAAKRREIAAFQARRAEMESQWELQVQEAQAQAANRDREETLRMAAEELVRKQQAELQHAVLIAEQHAEACREAEDVRTRETAATAPKSSTEEEPPSATRRSRASEKEDDNSRRTSRRRSASRRRKAAGETVAP